MTCGWIPITVALLLLARVFCAAQPAPAYGVVSYRSGDHTFEGYLFKPEGNGPFPSVIFNHGHAKKLRDAGTPAEYYAMARIFVNDGYVLFIPDRHMRYVGTNEYSAELLKLYRQDSNGTAFEQQRYTEVNDINARDVAAAAKWLRQQHYIDRQRIILSGWSLGALASLYATAYEKDVRALLLFSPGATQWEKPLARTFFRRSLESLEKPVFIVQGSNDPTTEPAKVAREILEKKKLFFRAEDYAHTGAAGQQHGSVAIQGWQQWGYDVMTFLEKVFAEPVAQRK